MNIIFCSSFFPYFLAAGLNVCMLYFTYLFFTLFVCCQTCYTYLLSFSFSNIILPSKCCLQKDPNAHGLKNKSFPFYNDWIEIFGKDRANGENTQTFSDIIQNVLNNNSQPEPSIGFNQSPQTPPFNENSQTEFQSGNRAESSSATTKSKSKK